MTYMNYVSSFYYSVHFQIKIISVNIHIKVAYDNVPTYEIKVTPQNVSSPILVIIDVVATYLINNMKVCYEIFQKMCVIN